MSEALRKVLVAEDEEKIARLLCDSLRAAQFDPVWVADGRDAITAARATSFSTVLLDLMLPGLDGLEVCRSLRQFSSVPVIMITARVDEIDRLLGLELGADDYVCKPFSPREVIARVRANIRRAEGRLDGTAVQAPQVQGGFTIDDARMRVLWNEQPIDLTTVEFRLMRLLVLQSGRVFSRAQILDAIHDDVRDISDRTVDSHIKNIRRKLAAVLPAHDCLVSVYGAGYRFERPQL